jgi:hypothetical protein
VFSLAFTQQQGAEMSGQVYDDTMFWLQIIGDAKRTIVCSPELESRIKTQIDARGIGGILTVQATRMWTDETRVIVIDEGALNASFNQSWVREGNNQ